MEVHTSVFFLFKLLEWRSRKSQPFFPLTYGFKVMTILSGDLDMFAKKGQEFSENQNCGELCASS